MEYAIGTLNPKTSFTTPKQKPSRSLTSTVPKTRKTTNANSKCGLKSAHYSIKHHNISINLHMIKKLIFGH